ncbi:hypothetical protein ABBQ32_008748 [Trebouxia sp. C0010 RCD-2024]
MGMHDWANMTPSTSVELCSFTLARKRRDELMWSVAHKRSRVSYYAKLRFIRRHGKETLYIAQIKHFLRAVNGDGHVLRLAVCELYGANYGLPGMRATEDIMTASEQSSQP